MNPNAHPSPQPSPLVGRGERVPAGRVRGVRTRCSCSGSWKVSLAIEPRVGTMNRIPWRSWRQASCLPVRAAACRPAGSPGSLAAKDGCLHGHGSWGAHQFLDRPQYKAAGQDVLATARSFHAESVRIKHTLFWRPWPSPYSRVFRNAPPMPPASSFFRVLVLETGQKASTRRRTGIRRDPGQPSRRNPCFGENAGASPVGMGVAKVSSEIQSPRPGPILERAGCNLKKP